MVCIPITASFSSRLHRYHLQLLSPPPRWSLFGSYLPQPIGTPPFLKCFLHLLSRSSPSLSSPASQDTPQSPLLVPHRPDLTLKGLRGQSSVLSSSLSACPHFCFIPKPTFVASARILPSCELPGFIYPTNR